MQLQTGETKVRGILKPLNILAGILGILLLVFGFFYVRDAWHWSNFVSRLKSEQGIVVTDAEHGWLTHSIAGLRDVLAINPENILAEYSFDKDDVRQNWKSFQDASPPFVVQRAEKVLAEFLKSSKLDELQKSNLPIFKLIGLGAEQSSEDCKVTFKITLE